MMGYMNDFFLSKTYLSIHCTLYMIDTFIVLQIINVDSKFDKQPDRAGFIFYIL